LEEILNLQESTPWSTGPKEILKHAISVLENDSDTNRRISFILIDNAVEQSIKSFLSLPKRVTGISITRKRLNEAYESFPSLLDLFEDVASSKIEDINLGIIEWYHRLRNELYHQGFGLTIEREKVEIYAELATILIKNLFDEMIELPRLNTNATILGIFLEDWNKLENLILNEAVEQRLQIRPRISFDAVRFLHDTGFIESDEYYQIIELRELRNAIIHNEESFNEVLNNRVLRQLRELVEKFEGLGDI
jgi:hypothetical protein